jgi:hypothetical protein
MSRKIADFTVPISAPRKTAAFTLLLFQV